MGKKWVNVALSQALMSGEHRVKIEFLAVLLKLAYSRLTCNVLHPLSRERAKVW